MAYLMIFAFLCVKKDCMGDRNDEIDLLELFTRIILLVNKNARILILAFFIGTALGLIHYQIIPRVYESKMILLSDILTSSYSERITESLNNLIIENNIVVLSEKLKLSVEDARGIGKIEIESLKKEVNDIPHETSTFIVTVRVFNTEILPKLQEDIINYIRNNEFVRIRVEQRRKYTNEIIKKIDEELRGLDQLKSRIMNGELVRSGGETLVFFDPTSVNSKILDLNKEKINLQNSLETINSIQLVEGFTKFEKPVSPKLSLSLTAGASFGLFLVGIIIAFKAVRKMVRISEEKRGKY